MDGFESELLNDDALVSALPDAASDDFDASRLMLNNLVATCLYNHPLNLARISWALGADYNASSFAAVQVRLLRPMSTALVFSSGRLVTTGATSESAALASIWLFTRLILPLEPGLLVTKIAIQNCVASGRIGRRIRLDALASNFKLDSIFDATLFPGLRLQLSNPPVKALLFAKGRCVLTGARCREDLVTAWSIVRKIAAPFLSNDESLDHGTLQVSKAAKRKAKIVDTTTANVEALAELASFKQR